MILMTMLFAIGLFGIYWIKENTVNQEFEVLEARTALLADAYTKSVERENVIRALRTVPIQPVTQAMTIANTDSVRGETATVAMRLKVMPAIPINHVAQIYDVSRDQVSLESASKDKVISSELPQPAHPSGTQKVTREVLDTETGTWLRVGIPYELDQSNGGIYYLSTRLHDNLIHSYIVIMISVGMIMLGGWGIVYVLSRSLTNPLRQLALAATQVSNGNYQPELPDTNRIKEAEISQLVHSFDDMAKRLGQLERMRTDLLGSVSHELRTPVTSIRGMIQAVKDGVVTGKEADEFMQISMDEAKRLQSMVNDLLDFTSMEAGAIVTEPARGSLSLLVRQVVSQIQAVPGFPGLEIHVHDVPDNLEWFGDHAHLKQIMLNLLYNSASAGATAINLHIEQEKTQLQIKIADNGKGIPPDEAPFIFERYYRGDSKRKKKQGLGLGLTICRMLAHANGGDVELLKTSSKGSMFVIRLPYAESSRP